ncbi:MAG: PilT/PilU family type 4a pilus ATPase [Erysipelotrichaceae bacterium]
MAIQTLIELAVEKKASDIFIVAGCPVEIKVNNTLIPITETACSAFETDAYIAELYDLSRHRSMDNIFKEGNDDFSFSLATLARFRVNVFRQRGSLAAVLRIVRFTIPTAKELHIPAEVTQFASLRKGLVIISGPAGSGKSSTLATLIDQINHHRSAHIVTIEDPIEFLHKHNKSIVSQREIGTDCFSTSVALKAALRQAPDVIFIGEMRDLDTIALAITAAETGHLVFSTLHTLGASNTIDRIIDVFPASQQTQIRVQLAMVLQAVISQQLVHTLDNQLLPVFEIMVNSNAIRNQIREGKTHQLANTIASSKEDGMVSMDTMLYDLVVSGKIDASEALVHSFDTVAMQKKLALLKPNKVV